MKKVFTFDIETIPNLEAGKNLLNLSSESDEVINDKLIDYHVNISSTGNAFFRQPFHKIACISYVESDFHSNSDTAFYSIQHIKSAGEIDTCEKEIIEGFSHYCGKNMPQIVTFNGKIFDIPVLQYRAMFHNISMEWFFQVDTYKKRGYANRYSDDNLDLIDFFGGYGRPVKMQEVASVFGIPCKQEGSGSDVYQMYKDGKMNKIRNYCETDAVVTFMLFLIYEHHKGAMNEYGLKKSMENLFNKLVSGDNHLQEFVEISRNSEFLSKFF